MTASPTRNAGTPARTSFRTRIMVGLAVALTGALGTLGAWLAFGQREGASPSPPPPTGPSWFRDVTGETGIAFSYRNGEEADQFSIMESLGGGIGLFDFDNDGLLDIFLPGGGYFDGPDRTRIVGSPCKLYRNLGDWKFKDVTAETGLDRAWHYTHGVAVADFDRDGWPDLLVTGYGGLVLLHNQPREGGGRTFVDVTEKLGLADRAWSTSAGWADLDGDGWPDLYVCHYVDWSFANNPHCPGPPQGVPRDICGPGSFKPLRHALFQNDQGRRLRDVSVDHGLRANGAGLGVVLVDVNGDAKPDIFVANDKNYKFLFVNRGPGKLEEKGMAAGVAVDDEGKPNGSMGVDAADYDGSGRASLWVTNFQGELQGLYRNLGAEYFRHDSQAAGIASVGTTFVSFGTAFVDVDNDGWEDLVIANGHVFRFPPHENVKQKPLLLHNVPHYGRRYFKEASVRGGTFFQAPARGRGLAVGDLDNDGWPDLLISHTNAPVAVLRNQGAQTGSRHWLGVKLMGKEHRDIVGSTVILENEGRKLTRFVKGGGSYLSANDSRILFGLDASRRVDRVTVHWSWGGTQTWEHLEPDAYWELTEGQAVARRGTR